MNVNPFLGPYNRADVFASLFCETHSKLEQNNDEKLNLEQMKVETLQMYKTYITVVMAHYVQAEKYDLIKKLEKARFWLNMTSSHRPIHHISYTSTIKHSAL